MKIWRVTGSAGGFAAWAYAMARMDVGRVTTGLYLVPAAAIVIALVWLGQAPGPVELAGGAIALAGVMLASSSGRRSRPHPPRPRPWAGSQVTEIREPASVR